ncbi:DNA polymerase III subunit delta', partial [Escherichia coli]|nr:DNA polymerase III subunit delta' [Escherichia coli]
GRLFDLLSLILSEKMMESANVREKMDAVLKAKKMWQANVSLQNSLEYITL